MEETFGSLILLTFCFIVSYWEYTKFGTYITPFGALAWPYTIIVLMINFGGKFFGFFPVSLKSTLFVIACLIFFLVGGYIVLFFIRKDLSLDSIKTVNIKEVFEFYRPLFISLGLISIIAGCIHFFQSVNEVGWLNIGTKDFSIAYGTGFLAHIQNLSRLAFIFLFADYILNRKKEILIILFLVFIIVVVRQVKYHVFVLLLGGLYFSYLHGFLRITLKKAFIYSLIVYFVFNLSYVVGFSVAGLGHAYSSKVQAFLFNHFFTYLFGGPIGFSEIMNNPSYPLYSFKEIVAVPINFYKTLTGDPRLVDIIIHKWVDVSNIYKYFHSANVFGIFGMVWVYLGSLATFIFIFIIGVVSYLFFGLAYKRNYTIGVQLVYAFIMSFLTLSFFGLYFNTVVFSEVSVYMLTLPPIYLITHKLIKITAMKHRLTFLKN